MDCLIRQFVSIDDSQFGLAPGRGTTDAIFVDLEKAFDGVPRKVIRWALRKLGVDCATVAGDVCQ